MGLVRSHADRNTLRRAGVRAHAGTAQRVRAGTTPRFRLRKRRTAHLVALLSRLGENDARKSLGLGLGVRLDLARAVRRRRGREALGLGHASPHLYSSTHHLHMRINPRIHLYSYTHLHMRINSRIHLYSATHLRINPRISTFVFIYASLPKSPQSECGS